MSGFVLQSISGIWRYIETCGNKEHLHGPKSLILKEKKKRYFRYEAFNKGGAMLHCGVDKGKEALQTIKKKSTERCVVLQLQHKNMTGFFFFFLTVLPHLISPHVCF